MRLSQLEFDAITQRIESNRAAKQGGTSATQISSLWREKDLHGKIIDYCKARNWIALHGSMATASHRTLGECDFTILAPEGRVFHVECKAKDGKLTPEQSGMHLWMSRLGHKAHVIRSMDEFLALVAPRVQEPFT